MEYKIKNEDNTPKLNLLAQSYKDAKEVTKLFDKHTLNWDKHDVIQF
jgi:hypothetical protein